MPLKMSFKISDWSTWDDTINDSAAKFHSRFSVYPNIMLACPHAYNKIDAYVGMFGRKNCQSSKRPGGPEPDDNITLNVFCSSKYSIEFCIDEKLPGDRFVLLFDAGGPGGGEDDEEYDESGVSDSCPARRTA